MGRRAAPVSTAPLAARQSTGVLPVLSKQLRGTRTNLPLRACRFTAPTVWKRSMEGLRARGQEFDVSEW